MLWRRQTPRSQDKPEILLAIAEIMLNFWSAKMAGAKPSHLTVITVVGECNRLVGASDLDQRDVRTELLRRLRIAKDPLVESDRF